MSSQVGVAGAQGIAGKQYVAGRGREALKVLDRVLAVYAVPCLNLIYWTPGGSHVLHAWTN